MAIRQRMPSGTAVPSPAGRDPARLVLGWCAAAGIGGAILIMLAVCMAGPSKAVVWLHLPALRPLWRLLPALPEKVVTAALWMSAIIGGAGVAAGIAAVSRGARPSARLLVTTSLLVTALFAVLPPAGSTDVVDYAVYGRMVVLGHDPYVMTPYRLRLIADPVALVAPGPWAHDHTAYGPLATAEQAAAAELGGASAARIAFWLKLWTALAFGAVALALDRLLRHDAARRARAHLIWSLNPLLLWGIVAAGHVDGVAAALGLSGLIVLGSGQPGERAHLLRALAAGALVGAAVDIKVTYAVFAVGLLWAGRKSFRALAAAAAGGLAVLVPSYLWFGKPSVVAIWSHTAEDTRDNFYQLFARALYNKTALPDQLLISVVLFAVTACLLLWRLPDGFPALPAVRPTLALAIAWLFVWPYQRSWYDAMMLCLLALYPATRLDWPVLVRLTAATFFTMPGMPGAVPKGAELAFAHMDRLLFIPGIRLLTLIAVLALCVSNAWLPWSRRPRLEPRFSGGPG